MHAIDELPPQSAWKEHGIILPKGKANAWDGSDAVMPGGLTKKGDTYYFYYLRGFRGCWEAKRKGSHTSLGLATSKDGRNWKKHSANPLLKPHDFVNVFAHEHGIRHASIKYVPELKKFIGYVGIEDPRNRSNTCGYMEKSAKNCKCNVEVDASIYGIESTDGINWKTKGIVSGVYNGAENYPRSFIYKDGVFTVWSMRSQGGENHSVSSGKNWLKLKGLKYNLWKWNKTLGEHASSHLHNDGNTVSLIVKITESWNHGGYRIGKTTLSNPTKIEWGPVWMNAKTTYQHGKIIKTDKEWLMVTTKKDIHQLVVLSAPLATTKISNLEKYPEPIKNSIHGILHLPDQKGKAYQVDGSHAIKQKTTENRGLK